MSEITEMTENIEKTRESYKDKNNAHYDFFPFDQENIAWHKDNKAITLHNPSENLPDFLKIQLREISHDSYCGYVVFKKSEVPNHWFNDEKHVDMIDMLEIHGGVTFKETFDDFLVIGFDCNHAEDLENTKTQDLNYVIEITQQMEDQLRLHLKNLGKFRKLKTKDEKIMYIDEIRAKAKFHTATNIFGILNLATEN